MSQSQVQPYAELKPDRETTLLSEDQEIADSMATPAPQSHPVSMPYVLILSGLSAVASLSTDMYLPTLPKLSQDLGVGVSQTQVTLSAGIIGLALGQVVLGPISDAIGRKKPLLVGMAIFTLASLLCVFAPTMRILVALRFVQGFTGAAGIVLSLAIVNDLYSGTAQARFLSLLTGISGLSPIAAPVLGSQLVAVMSWRGIFLTLALIGAGLFLATAWGIGETLEPNRRQQSGLRNALSAFRAELTNGSFLGYALLMGFTFANGIIYISVAPFVLQMVYGLTAQTIGMLFGINALGIVILSQINGRLVGKVPAQTLLMLGAILLGIGGTSLFLTALNGAGLWGEIPSAFLVIASLGVIAPNATTLALAKVRAAGSAAALLGVIQIAIGAVAAPLVGLADIMTPVPLTAAIAAFSVAALVTAAILGRPIGQPIQAE